jgi:phage terminase small subunit
MPLNDRQRRFVAAYVELGVATRAAIAAGYSEKTAYQQGHMLLKNPEIAAAVDELQANLANAMGLTRQRVLAMHEQVFDLAVAASQLTAANRAAELIGKTHGMYTDRAVMDIGATVVYELQMQGADLTETAEAGE